jgi:hypothetical protein
MIHPAYRSLAGLAFVLFIGCSRDVTPAPEGPTPALTPASRPLRPPPDRPFCTERFELLDDDGDDRVSPEEFETHAHPYPGPEVLFHNRDIDGDGFLSEAEFCSSQAKRREIGPGQPGHTGASP